MWALRTNTASLFSTPCRNARWKLFELSERLQIAPTFAIFLLTPGFSPVTGDSEKI
jgi:hypothetical protein